MKILPFIIIILFLFTNILCNNPKEHKHSHETEHNHEHEKPETENNHNHAGDELPEFSKNLFGKNLELFFESSVFVVGKTSKIIAHFNFLSNFKPVKKGKLTVKLENQNSNITVSTTKLLRTGIFLIELKPEKSGNHKLVFLYEDEDIKDNIELKNVRVFTNKDAAFHQSETEKNTHEISYLKEQMWKTDFETQEIKLKDFSQTVRTIGEILPVQGAKRIISSKTSGTVIFSARNLVPGKRVKSGEELFKISNEVIGSENINVIYEKLKNEYEQCKILYERHKKLASEEIISNEILIETHREFISDSILYFNFLSGFSKKGVSINSKISGYVQNVFIDEGQYVTTGQSLAVISANRKMMIRADVPLKHYNFVHNITEAIFELPFANKTISSKQLKGKVISVGSAVQNEGKYIPVYFEIKNDGSLIEGAFITCFLKKSNISNQIVVPKSALIEELGIYYVFVQTNGESFEKREVKIAATDGISFRIISGLSPEERIVTKGAMQIKLASITGGIDSHAGHNH